MGKASIFLYLTVALLLLFFLSHSPKKQTGHRHRRLKLRSHFTFSSSHRPVTFDPLVAEIERRREERHWEKHYFELSHEDFPDDESAAGEESQPEWEDFIDAEDYLNDEDKFNVTDRLIVLFPRIDVDTTDGFVSEHELTEWNLQQAQREILHRTKRDMDVHDKNHDGFVSFSEYEPPSWVHIADNNSFGYNVGWWKEEHFKASDADGNGLLNLTEYNDFLHPADTKNPKLLGWLCREEVRERDTDKDGKMNFKEFFHGLFDLVRTYEEENHNGSYHSDFSGDASARVLFNQLDNDDDGHLSDVELLSIIGKIHPPERYYAKQQADYIISQADVDKDGRLTLAEMIENPYVFYSAIFNDDEDQYDYHDEFR
ncbi:calumenin-B [Neltuma alba]|uniref:calumenin-B n=1 Tax=Neltuma alba TaxID=207710 RepID=UPI0010A3C446|nr:calumenin-B-like [Prosopis alba]